MKISFFVHDLAENPIGRVVPIAGAMQKIGYEVEIIGFILGVNKEVYAPYKDMFTYRTIAIPPTMSAVLTQSPRLATLATGDIIYACKPLWTSYCPALLASRFGKRKPLLLDIEDDELYFSFHQITPVVANQNHSQRNGIIENQYKRLSRLIKRLFVETEKIFRHWNNPIAIQYKLILHPLTHLCVNKTVVSSKLQRRYGGEILLHGPDEIIFNPERPDLSKNSCRKLFGLPKDIPLILFAGKPHLHKGLRTIVAAMNHPETVLYHLVLVAPPDHSEVAYALRNLGNRCLFLGMLPNSQMPALLTAIDVVALPQQHNGFAEAQVPAKMLEAMAMAKPIIASWVGDLPEILGERETQPRGWLFSPLDDRTLACILNEILQQPDEAQRRGEAARRYFLEHASSRAIAETVQAILQRII